MTRCDFRTHGECRCNPGQCQQQQPAHDLGRFKKPTPPPLYGPSLLDAIAAALMLSGLLIWGAILAENHIERRDRIEQESRAIMRASR